MEKLLNKKDIMNMYSINKSTLTNWIKNKKFPEPSIKISTHKYYWIIEDIEKFFSNNNNNTNK